MSSQVEQIKSRLSIVDVVQSYIKLQKAGINFKANCPFHSEKTPSFFVSPSRDSWHCFGCNKGGDIFSFVMDIEGVEFPEALRILANRAGVELKQVSPSESNERTKLLQLLEDAKNFYESELKKNKDVIEYLKERGVKGETAKSFGIGFAPDGWRNLYDFLKLRNYSDSEIEKTGMILKSQNANLKSQNSYYDRFRGRIMFPLSSSSGQVVGFSGRIFGDQTEEKGGKYINSPQTVLYDKSKVLYGFDKSKVEIRKKDACILVEGQMDVIMSHQAGVTNAVAVSGTALTEEHLKIIKRLTNNLIISFDKDEAGFEAMKRGIDMALKEGFEIKIAVVSFGKDPADVIKEDPKLWEDSIGKAKHLIDFYLNALSEKNKDDRILKREVEKLVLPYVAVISSEIERAHWIKEIANKLGISEEPVRDEVKKIQYLLKDSPLESGKESPAEENYGKKTRKEFLEDRLIGFILWQKNKKDPSFTEGDINWAILKTRPLISSEKRDLLDKNEKNNDFIFQAEIFYSGTESLKDELKKLILEFEKETIKDELEEIGKKIHQLELSGKDDEISVNLQKFHELSKKLSEL